MRTGHLVVIGASGVGKTSLMVEAANQDPNYVLERNWTYRRRRPGEGDDELVFVDQEQFDLQRPKFLSTHVNCGGIEYGVPHPTNRIGQVTMRALPVSAVEAFRSRAEGRVSVCAVVLPDNAILADRILGRDPSISEEELAGRLTAVEHETRVAQCIADAIFVNKYPDLVTAATQLREQVEKI